MRALRLLPGFALLFLGFASVSAANPASGSISLGGVVDWDAGPVAGAGQGRPAQCIPGNCDAYSLTVNLPSNLAQLYSAGEADLTLAMTWSTTAGEPDDLDITAQGPDGSVYGPGNPDGFAGPEVLTIADPLPGDYAVWVDGGIAPEPTMAHVHGTFVYTPFGPPNVPPLPRAGDPTYANYLMPPQTLNPEQSAFVSQDAAPYGEPSVGVDWATGAVMYQANLQTFKLTFDDASVPAKITWTDVSSPQTGAANLDPILFTDHQTNRTFVSQLMAACSVMVYSDDDGSTWTPSQGCGVPVLFDHQTVGGGPYSSAATVPPVPDPTGYANAVYYCAQTLEAAECARSDDGGLTFGNGVPISNGATGDCAAIHGHVKVAPDGTVYVPVRSCGSGQGGAVSTDNGLTWNLFHVPGTKPAKDDPSIGIDSANAVYMGMDDGSPEVAVSHDQGATWSKPVNVGAQFNIDNTEFPVVVAGDAGRAAFAFLGTTTHGNDQGASFGCDPPAQGQTKATNCPAGIWHMYVATTYDGGSTWTTVDATPNTIVQRGCIWNGGGGNPCRNMLDFNDIQLDKTGHVVIAYTMGCTGKCQTSTAAADNDHASVPGVIRQECGKGLLAAYDSAPRCAGAPAPLPVSASVRSASATHALPNTAGAPALDYRVLLLLILPSLLLLMPALLPARAQ